MSGGPPPLCRVHTGSTVADVFAATPRDGGRHLREAIAQIEEAGRGADMVTIDVRHDKQFEATSTLRQRLDTPRERAVRAGGSRVDQHPIRALRLTVLDPQAVALGGGQHLDRKHVFSLVRSAYYLQPPTRIAVAFER